MALETSRTHENQSLRAPASSERYVPPPVDIYETDTGYVVLADMPGVSADGLDIHVEHDRLTIRGRVGREPGPTPQHQEFVLGDYYRAFTLADEIDTERIRANLKDGVLRLELPKAAHAQVRKIPVTVQ